MARVTGVGKGGAGYPQPGVPISKELTTNRDQTKAVATGVVLVREARTFKATKEPVGDSKKVLTAAKRSMPTWKGY